MLDEERQSQGDDQKLNTPPGEDQVDTDADGTPSGAEGDDQPKTYTEEEWSERESKYTEERAASDKRVAAADRQVADAAMRQQIEQAEADALDQDRGLVEAGDITEVDLERRRGSRQTQVKEEVERRDRRAQEDAASNAMMVRGEEMGRVVAANDFAKEFDIDVEELLSDETIKSPAEMKLKARELAMDKREADITGDKKFDSGRSGAISVDTTGMNPMALAEHAYGDEETGRRKSRRN